MGFLKFGKSDFPSKSPEAVPRSGRNRGTAESGLLRKITRSNPSKSETEEKLLPYRGHSVDIINSFGSI